MTPTLAECQYSFSQALRYQRNGADCDIISDHFSADERIQIYRNNFVMSLTEVLALTYPLVSKLVGTECFEGLARKHILETPLLTSDVSTFGDNFSRTIESTKIVASAVPYLSDIAEFEWKIDTVGQNCSDTTEPLRLRPFSDLSSIPINKQSDIILFPRPGMMLCTSAFSVFSIRKAILKDSFENLDIKQVEHGYVFSLPSEDINIGTLSNKEFMLLSLIDGSISLAEIEPDLLGHLPNLLSLNLFSGFCLD